MKAVRLCMVLLFVCVSIVHGQSGRCEQLEFNRCSSCLEIPECVWCSAVDYGAARCQTLEEHSGACPDNHTVTGDPDAEPNASEEDLTDLNQISPKRVSATVRVGVPIKFQIDVQPAKNYPVDFYYLMDLTRTMADDLQNLKSLALNISAKLNELTDNSRLAFGSFVDKVVPPYVKFQSIGKPYGAGLDEPYDYKHVLSFTSEAKEFEAKIKEQVTSGNRDVPEGTFDALMQVAACENELGWQAKDKTRRMVLIATDGTFHIAGEGKFGGVVKPNDERCWLGPETSKGVRFYNRSLELDYPSVNQVYQRLKASDIQPIFAIGGGPQVTSTYDAVVSTWKDIGATSGVLDGDSSNIIELIQESYDKITSTVILNPTSTPDGIEIKIQRNCPSASGVPNNECKDVKPGIKVSFDISVTATSCKYGNKSSFELRAAGFGGVQVDLDIICSCDCESSGIPNSPKCKSNGTLVCGACECNPGRSGQECQCDAEQFVNIDENLCKSSNQTGILACEGNGVCDCGVCKCNLVPGQTGKYYGDFCQCSNYNCPLFNGVLCGDRGECKCGECNCDTGYKGDNCGQVDCALYMDQCLVEAEGGAEVNCSNHGTCDCGVCRCDAFYEGNVCQNCPSCAGRCGDYKQCVLCEVFDATPSNATLCDNCPSIKKINSLDELKKLNLPTTCTETDDDGCTYYYTYENKNNVTQVYAVQNKDCPEGPDVLLIVLIVIGSIVGIGIILLILWKVLTALVDRREYQKFEQDRAKSKWHREKNPLYQPATSTVQNPTFVGAKS